MDAAARHVCSTSEKYAARPRRDGATAAFSARPRSMAPSICFQGRGAKFSKDRLSSLIHVGGSRPSRVAQSCAILL